jgi:hypothetical protein
MEKLFITMFYKIQTPWKLYKNSSRKSFMSYSYVLYKFCELLELDNLLEYFSLYKDIEKIELPNKVARSSNPCMISMKNVDCCMWLMVNYLWKK